MIEELIAFAARYWLQWFFGGCTAILAWLYKGMSDKIKAEHTRNEAIAAGVESLLREAIVSNYNKYTEKGYCPIYAKESIKRVYAAYHDLGGNDVATELYKKLLAMPETEANDDE